MNTKDQAKAWRDKAAMLERTAEIAAARADNPMNHSGMGDELWWFGLHILLDDVAKDLEKCAVAIEKNGGKL